MLRTVNKLKAYRLGAIDGEIGHAREFYFDDHSWKIRYLVADIGHWLPGRKVLIVPQALGSVDDEKKIFHVQLTMRQLEGSPPIDADQPISRQMEEEYLRYFGWPFYWMDPVFWGAPMTGGSTLPVPAPTVAGKRTDPHLRSTDELERYHIHARDGDIGHVEDFLIDDTKWEIRHLVAATRNWWPGKKILISPMWIEKVSWEESKVFVDVTRELIKKSPPYEEPAEPRHPDEAKAVEDFQNLPPFLP